MNAAVVRVLGLALSVSVALSASAEIITFDATVGDWSEPSNWSPAQVPVAADTAIIQNGKHCKVEVNHQFALKIQVDSGGTLSLIGKKLTLGSTSGSETSTINGTLAMKSAGSTPGQLACQGSVTNLFAVTLSGTGTINARRDDGNGVGEFVRGSSGGAATGFYVTSGLTVVGSIRIKSSLWSEASFRVDDQDDTLELGTPGGILPALHIKGPGEFRISAGLMDVGLVALAGTERSPDWNLSGSGEIDVRDVTIDDIFLNRRVKLIISGGLLDVHQSFSADADITFTGGQIRIAQGHSFSVDPTLP